MIKLSLQKQQRVKQGSNRYRRLTCMGKTSAGIINDLSSPIDAVNRFINLTLQNIEENSQSREFLLESKKGIRETLRLIKRLNDYAKKIEKEISEISAENRQGEYLNSE